MPRRDYTSSYGKVEGKERVPEKLRQHGLCAAHWRPHSGYQKIPGNKDSFVSFRMNYEEAWKKPYINIRDGGACHAAIVLDCDDCERVEAGIEDLPCPNWVIRTNRGYHLAWALAVPVKKLNRKACAYLDRIREYFEWKVGADPHFKGMGRNPLDKSQDVRWMRKEAYTFEELAKVRPQWWERYEDEDERASSNGGEVFYEALRWAGKREHLILDVRGKIDEFCTESRIDLSDRFKGKMAERIEGYRRKWEKNGWHKLGYREQKQRAGRLGGAKSRRKANPLVAKLMYVYEISKATAYRWIKAGDARAREVGRAFVEKLDAARKSAYKRKKARGLAERRERRLRNLGAHGMVPGGEKISDTSVLGKGGALVGWHGVALLGEGLLSKGKRLWRRWARRD